MINCTLSGGGENSWGNGTKEKKKPVPKISIPHLRSRAKVYLAMGNLKAAAAAAEQVSLAVNQKAGYISMRTDDLEEAEALRETREEAKQ